MIKSDFTHYLKDQNPKNIFIIGGGPSLQKLDTTALQKSEHFIICCNQAFKLFPYANIAHHSDYQWWLEYQSELEQNFLGDYITGCGLGHSSDYPSNVTRLYTVTHDTQHELFQSSNRILGNNCGLQALALAHLFQPENIILIGFDFTADRNMTHGYEKSNLQSVAHYEKFWQIFLKDFKRFERLKNAQWSLSFPNTALPKIWNLNPNSALDLYDRSKCLSDFTESNFYE